MPYDKPSELPDKVRSHLPLEAQKLFLKVFNNAWQEYEDPQKRKRGGSQEEAAHRVAWAAVKKKYKKGQDGNWQKK